MPLLGQTSPVRYLTIVRHCKASPAVAGGADYERRLSDRGRRQGAQLRAWVHDNSELGRFGPCTALVSSAARTRETFQLGFEGTDFVRDHHYSTLIYNGSRHVSSEDLLIDLASIDPVTRSLLVIAHNPTVHELLLALAKKPPKSVVRDGYPLGGAYVLELGEGRHLGLEKYEVVASYVPD